MLFPAVLVSIVFAEIRRFLSLLSHVLFLSHAMFFDLLEIYINLIGREGTFSVQIENISWGYFVYSTYATCCFDLSLWVCG